MRTSIHMRFGVCQSRGQCHRGEHHYPFSKRKNYRCLVIGGNGESLQAATRCGRRGSWSRPSQSTSCCPSGAERPGRGGQSKSSSFRRQPSRKETGCTGERRSNSLCARPISSPVKHNYRQSTAFPVRAINALTRGLELPHKGFRRGHTMDQAKTLKYELFKSVREDRPFEGAQLRYGRLRPSPPTQNRETTKTLPGATTRKQDPADRLPYGGISGAMQSCVASREAGTWTRSTLASLLSTPPLPITRGASPQAR